MSTERIPNIWTRIWSHYDELWKLTPGVESYLPFLREKRDLTLILETTRLDGVNQGRRVLANPPIHLDSKPIGRSPLGLKDRGFPPDGDGGVDFSHSL